jgi:hypothetical protein
MTQVREHRGSLDESLATVRSVADRAELVALIHYTLEPFGQDVKADDIFVTPYGRDERIGWDTHLITIRDYGVWGMADGPL